MGNQATVLRLLAWLSFMIAAIVMLCSYQKIDDGFTKFTISAYDWKGLMFCVFVNFIASGYNMLVILCIPDGDPIWRRVIVGDVIMNILVGASLGAGWQTYALTIQGNKKVSWAPICEVTTFFCNKVLGSLITSTFGFVISIGLLMWSLRVALVEEYP